MSIDPPRTMIAASSYHGELSRARPIFAAILASVLGGCDIVQGFQDAGDTLFPEESTHLAAPGLRLVRGQYRSLGVAAGSELYLLARAPDDETSTLYAMRYASPKPCAIPNVVRFITSAATSASSALLAYLEEDARAGTLRFADTTCRRFDLTLADARLPVGDTPKGLVIWAGEKLLLVNPRNGEQEVLWEGVEQVIHEVFGGRHIVVSAGRFAIFDREWVEEGVYGQQVETLARTNESVIYEDAGGIHRVAQAPGASGLLAATIARDGCMLGMRDGVWATYYSPCLPERLVAFNDRTGDASVLGFDADPRFLQLEPARDAAGDDPAVDPYWFFHLRDVDPATNLGTLMVRTPEGEEHALGERATLQRLAIRESDGETHGYALTEVDGATASYVWWRPDGTTRRLARNVLRDSRRLIVDFDGTAGNLAAVSGDRLEIVAEAVPARAFEFEDRKSRWTTVFHGFDGQNGRLSVFDGGIDDLQGAPLDQPMPSVALEGIAGNVQYFSSAVLDEVLPGVMYLADYDLVSGTGRLEYRNLELGFTALVNYGVADYFVAADEVLYSIPYGDSAGIWLVQAK